MIENKSEFINKINKNQVVALIPARGGSKGVPKKNIQKIKEFPLIAYTIAAGILSKEIERVIVSTDSEEIAQTALRFGAEVPFLRPAEYSSDSSGDIEFVEHAIRYMYSNEETIPEYLVHLRPTTPFRKTEIIDEAIRLCIGHAECSSLRSGHKASESPYKWFLRNDEGYFRSLRGDIDNDMANTARQQFPDVYIPDGYVDVLRSSYVIKEDKLHGSKMLGFESPYCAEIDTIEDLDYIRFQIERNGFDLYEYLKQNY